jgi:Flp pilus assembly pilin Flp
MIKAYMTVKNQLNRGEEGQGLVEYSLITLLVGVALVAALGLLAGDIEGVFTAIGGALTP